MDNTIIIKKEWSRDTVLEVYVIPGQRAEVHTVTNGNLVNVKVFRPGDEAEYDSFNLRYTARIKSITAKNAVFEMESWSAAKGTTKRLPWDRFAWRNRDFNAVEVARYNAIETMNL
jgi:hypothetical protein